MRRSFLALCLLAILAGCSSHAVRGSINGIEYRMTLDREPVPGGEPYSISAELLPDGSGQGQLYVDGVNFGVVDPESLIRVDRQARVWVDDTVRAPGEAAPGVEES